MKKIISILFLFVCLSSVLPAQPAEKLFVSMPEFLSLTLTETNRLELVELYKGGLPAAVENLMG
ncbi:MAG: DUF3256 family protein, partial [Candidatus Symbiothrix sp.]|nr:DUF3256 family protein [Candidatus Symbiothrix sp.]